MSRHIHRRDHVAGRDPTQRIDDRDRLGRFHWTHVRPDSAHRLARRQEIRIAFVAVGKRFDRIHAPDIRAMPRQRQVSHGRGAGPCSRVGR